MNPKRHQLSIVMFVAAAAAVSFFASCAEMESNNTKSLLSAAGFHMLTPQTDRTTHYFFTAVRFNVMTADDALNAQIQEKISTTRRFAFEEQDAPVIEAQQEIIDAAETSVDPVILAIDVGPVRYKKILERLIRAEGPQQGLEGDVNQSRRNA